VRKTGSRGASTRRQHQAVVVLAHGLQLGREQAALASCTILTAGRGSCLAAWRQNTAKSVEGVKDLMPSLRSSYSCAKVGQSVLVRPGIDDRKPAFARKGSTWRIAFPSASAGSSTPPFSSAGTLVHLVVVEFGKVAEAETEVVRPFEGRGLAVGRGCAENALMGWSWKVPGPRRLRTHRPPDSRFGDGGGSTNHLVGVDQLLGHGRCAHRVALVSLAMNSML